MVSTAVAVNTAPVYVYVFLIHSIVFPPTVVFFSMKSVSRYVGPAAVMYDILVSEDCDALVDTDVYNRPVAAPAP